MVTERDPGNKRVVVVHLVDPTLQKVRDDEVLACINCGYDAKRIGNVRQHADNCVSRTLLADAANPSECLWKCSVWLCFFVLIASLARPPGR